MAAISMTTAVAGTSTRSFARASDATSLRNAGAVSMAAPTSASSSLAISFVPELSFSKRTAMNSAIVARAADLEFNASADIATEEAPAVQDQGSKLYVGNLPWSCDSAQLAEICQDHGVVDAVEVIYDQESGRSRGFAFVTMASNADAQALINALDGADMGGRPLRVNYPQSNRDKPRFERSERPERRFPDGGGMRGRRPDDPNKVFVGNLTWGYDDGALYQLFSDFGKVVEANIVYDRESGKSRGFGFVTFENTSDVNRAIENLDGAECEGRQLRVNLAGDRPPPRF